MAGHTIKRWLYLTHRWLGIVSCLLFAMWFVSGLVMVYVPFPSLDREEWLAGQAPITWSKVAVDPGTVFTEMDPENLRRLHLEMRGNEPVWRWQAWDGEESVRFARAGQQVANTTRVEALAIALSYGKSPPSDLRLIESDQWTVAGRYGSHRPLWKAEFADDAGLNVYVSSKTGAVLLQTTRMERFWNWLGAVPHWIYPRLLREHGEAWRQVILWSSGPAIVVGLTGIWIGIARIRLGRKRFKGGRVTPYRGWMKWHHLTGLGGSVFLILWIFSGWLSVDPGRYFAGSPQSAASLWSYTGRVATSMPVDELARVFPNAQRVTITSAAGINHLIVEQRDEPLRKVNPEDLQPMALPAEVIETAVASQLAEAQIESVTVLNAPDSYWYRVNTEATLPVMRVKLADEDATWLHIDARTGDFLGSITARDRLYRWLFNLFHRWDYVGFLERDWARQAVIWLFSLLGLAGSITGIWIGWIRLRGKPRAARP